MRVLTFLMSIKAFQTIKVPRITRMYKTGLIISKPASKVLYYLPSFQDYEFNFLE